jgi:diguanylate cyclase (GGDEF)-like protein
VPIEQLLLLLGVVTAVVLTLIGVIVAAWIRWCPGAEEIAPLPVTTEADTALSILGPWTAADVAALDVVRPGTADRTVRVIAFLFLAAVAVFVAVTHAFPDTVVEIELLLAAGILFVVFMHDLLPASVLGRARYWIEATAAIAFMGALTGLSGGLSSPFLPGFFLIVAGATLASGGVPPILLAALAGLTYGLVGLLVAGPTAILPTSLVWLGFNLVALALLAYLASVAGREQRRAREAAIGLSHFDPLTGLYNRSFFFSVMEREIRRAARTGRAFSLLMVDVDDLKPVNDTFGHQFGDRLLRAITDVVQRGIRGTDIAARYGGDEFVVMLPETDPAGAFVVAEKLRSDVAALAVHADERSIRTSVSIGLVAYGEEGTTIETLMSSVDEAMYESKRRGKNQIVGYVTRTERVATAMGQAGAEAWSPAPVAVDPLAAEPSDSPAARHSSHPYVMLEVGSRGRRQANRDPDAESEVG